MTRIEHILYTGYSILDEYSGTHGSTVKSTACSSKGPEFNFQQPLSGSQPYLMRSGAL